MNNLKSYRTLAIQMILNLEKEELVTYFNTNKNILSIESWIFSFERALKLPKKPKEFIKQISLELPQKLGNDDSVFVNLIFDICAKYNLEFEPWMEDRILKEPDLCTYGMKEKTFIWLLQNLSESSSVLKIVLKEFLKQYQFIGKQNIAQEFQNNPDQVDIEAIIENFDKSQANIIKSKENLIILFSIFTSKIRSIDHLAELELRLAIECNFFSKLQLLKIIESYSNLDFRLPNLRLLDLACDYLANKVEKLTFEENLVLLESFSKMEYINSHLMLVISKQLDERFLQKEVFSEEELQWVGKTVFYLAKLDFLSDDVFETFSSIFRREIKQLNSESISMFAFANARMVTSKLEVYESKIENGVIGRKQTNFYGKNQKESSQVP